MKGAVAAAVVVALLPCAGQAQSWFTPGPTQGGFYIGIESGTTWFLNNNGYSMNTGWTTGAFVGYEFPWGIRAEFSGTYRANMGTGPGQVPTLVDTNTTTTTPSTTTAATTVTTTTPPTTTTVPPFCNLPGVPLSDCSPSDINPGSTTTTPGTTTTTLVPGTTIPGTTTTTTTTTQITK